MAISVHTIQPFVPSKSVKGIQCGEDVQKSHAEKANYMVGDFTSLGSSLGTHRLSYSKSARRSELARDGNTSGKPIRQPHRPPQLDAELAVWVRQDGSSGRSRRWITPSCRPSFTTNPRDTLNASMCGLESRSVSSGTKWQILTGKCRIPHK